MKNLLLFLGMLTFSTQTFATDFKDYQIFGTYNLGCISKTVEFPLKSKDYQVQIYGEGRNFAHPLMIEYLNSLIKRAKEAKLPPLLIGDLSKKNGGPYGAKSNHASHAIGLDVDLPFDFASPKKSDYELHHPKDRYIVNSKGPNQNFDKKVITLIKLAASDSKVERIFVHPRIKQHLCKTLKGEDRKILQVLRPWFGHRAHMHVRLACPKDSPYCKAQAKVPAGNGCLETETWFLPPDPKAKPVKAQVRKKKQLPPQCKAILKI